MVDVAPVAQDAPAQAAANGSIPSTFGQTRAGALRMLLEAGVHFGHQSKRWNPKMKRFIFTERNGIHIIDLQQTVFLLEDAQKFIADLTARGGKVLFVGTKKQATDIVEREAVRSGQYYINKRWMGGTLTNFVTIRNRLRALKQLQGQRDRGEFDFLPKQEAAKKLHELEKLEKTLGGMRDMSVLPGAVFIIDTKREHLAVQEARRLNIPIIALTDTNSDPDDADFIVPANDDAIRALRLLAASISDAAINGQMRMESAASERPTEGGRGRGRDQGPLTAESFASPPPQGDGDGRRGGQNRRPAQNRAPQATATQPTAVAPANPDNAPTPPTAPVADATPTENAPLVESAAPVTPAAPEPTESPAASTDAPVQPASDESNETPS